MKAQLSKPVRSKATYTKEYKEQALELWRNSGRSAAKVRFRIEKAVADYPASKQNGRDNAKGVTTN